MSKNIFFLRSREWDGEKYVQKLIPTPYAQELHAYGEIFVIHTTPSPPTMWKMSHKGTGLSVSAYVCKTQKRACKEGMARLQNEGPEKLKEIVQKAILRDKELDVQ